MQINLYTGQKYHHVKKQSPCLKSKRLFFHSFKQPTGIIFTPESVVYAIFAFAQITINAEGSLYTSRGCLSLAKAF